jgi:hypothetical protein
MNETSKSYKYVELNIEIIKNNVDIEEMSLTLYQEFKINSFDMIESTAYFESYVHVLKKIKLMDQWYKIPFSEVIALG